METRLKQIGQAFRTTKYRRSAVFECICGNKTVVDVSNFKHGQVRSCGCLSSEVTSTRNTSHGMSGTPEYEIWCGMLKRCKNHPGYAGRGITVCPRWKDFTLFYSDMGPRPSSNHSVERKDNDKGYDPTNCVWATAATQNRNTRRNMLLTAFGKTQCIQDWAKEVGMNRLTLRQRIVTYAWDVETALTTPVKRN